MHGIRSLLSSDEGAFAYPFARPDLRQPVEHRLLRARPTLGRARLWNGNHVWLATRYDDVRTILSSPQFSSSAQHPNYPALSPSHLAVASAEDPPTLIRQHGPAHTAMRRIFAGEFSHARVQALQPLMHSVIGALCDNMQAAGPPFEFARDFALALPSQIISRILGVPYEDHAFFEENSSKKIDLTLEPAEALDAAKRLRAYLWEILKEKARDPDKHDDLLSRTYSKHVATGELGFDELLSNIELLILAGHETTANMTALSALTLIQNPDAFETLRIAGEGSTAQAMVEELLRYLTIVHHLAGRVALSDFDVGGVTIGKGDAVIAMLASANHDPDKFPEADRFDFTRPKMPAHVAFGFGAHQCLGQTLARAELGVVLPAIVKRFPGLRLAAPVETLPFKGDTLSFGITSMPVCW